MTQLKPFGGWTVTRGGDIPVDLNGVDPLMHANRPPVRRVTVVVLDGLRPDAIDRFSLFTVARLAQRGAHTMRGHAVSPSVTAAAMATLFTGASPERHGLQSDHFALPRSRGLLHPWPRLLREEQLETAFVMSRIPTLYAPVARGFGKLLGVVDTRFGGDHAADIATEALRVLAGQRDGAVVVHLPDADRAGHEHGWMSPEYAMAAGRMDNALARIARTIDLDDPRELLIVCADHGGGGAHRTAHDSTHPHDTTIPVVLAGGGVVAGDLGGDVQWADLPATLLWSLGFAVPATYAGAPLTQAFHRREVAA